MPWVEVVIMANSRKTPGRCVAGIRNDGGGWVRPLGVAGGGALEAHEYRCQGGHIPVPLDIVRIPLGPSIPDPHQPENYLLERGQWRFEGEATPESALSFLEQYVHEGGPLFGHGGDRIAYDYIERHPTEESLTLVKLDAEDVTWIRQWQVGHRRPQMRAQFEWDGRRYDLAVTDPEWERRFSGWEIGEYESDDAGIPVNCTVFLTVSLGEPWQGNCYKLVAGVTLLPA